MDHQSICKEDKMMRKIRIQAIVPLSAILLAFVLLYLNGSIGVSKSHIEQQARMDMSVDASWDGVIATGNGLSGMLFFDETRSNYIHVIFSKRPIGYSFASGGCTQLEMKGVVKYDRDTAKEAVYLSMNQQRINKVAYNYGGNVEIALDPTKPFALILPHDISGVSFYDVDGNHVALLVDRY